MLSTVRLLDGDKLQCIVAFVDNVMLHQFTQK